MCQSSLLLKQHGEITFSVQPCACVEREPFLWGKEYNKARDGKACPMGHTLRNTHGYFSRYQAGILVCETQKLRESRMAWDCQGDLERSERKIKGQDKATDKEKNFGGEDRDA